MNFIVPAPYYWKTGGSIYNRRVIETLHWSYTEEHGSTGPSIIDGMLLTGKLPRQVVGAVVHLLPRHYHIPSLADDQKVIQELRGLDFVIVTGEITQNALEAEGIESHLVPPGATHLPYITHSKDEYLLTVGAVTPLKNQLNLISWVGDRNQIVIVGDLNRDPDYSKIVSRKRCKLVGEVEDPTPYYIQASAYLHASLFESYGITLLEAMSYSLPTVAFDAGNVKTTVGRGGIVVDSSDEFQEAIRMLMDDPVMHSYWSKRAHSRSLAQPSWNDQAELIGEIVRSYGYD